MYANRVPKVEVITSQNAPQVIVAPLQQQQQQQHQQPVAQLPNFKDDEKMPLFLIKLWSIVEDPQYQQIVRWDESGYSFHIIDPYSFCRNVLPHFFKHNNLNSLIRQLNMYGFRKMTPVDRGSLARTESDQDHLEFSHPYFIRDHPEFLVNIKRKQSSRSAENSTNGVQAQATIQLVMEEMRQLREKQRTTDSKMHELVKENEQLWEQVTLLRAQHNRQQQVVTKLVQFLVAMMQPNSTVAKRVMKRGVLAIDEPPQKRMRMNSNLNSNNSSNLTDILDRLQREMLDIGGIRGVAAAASRADGPIIADVTDEWVPGASSNSPPGQTRNKQPFGSNAYNMSPNMQMTASPSSNSTASMGLTPQKRAQNGEAQAAISGPAQTNGATLSPSITMSPSLERQFSQDFQDYLNGIDLDIDKCRDLLGNHWDFNLFDNVDVGEDQDQPQSDGQQHETNTVNSTYNGFGMQNGTAQQPGLLTYHLGPQLALEGGPLTTDTYRGNPQVELVEEDTHADVNPRLEFPCTPLVEGDDLLFPSTPDLLTPCTSPRP
ncbi:hypothetical protein V3C99_005137 [Haemonchus contortus]|uniref:HSF_DOMAIN domain-containing protein n=1 Tax=Haemonchus contortus TaxID=6289 RepID=A0A7I4XVE9_HAECO|nr:Heat shock factor (HSF)-type domain containing protein [Haemonchus contortus]CDJ96998.1 Heat shock factor (HSF)-type domain containing protein [Haemonchus contortus]